MNFLVEYLTLTGSNLRTNPVFCGRLPVVDMRRRRWPALLLVSAVIATWLWKSRPKHVAESTPTGLPLQEMYDIDHFPTEPPLWTALRHRANKVDDSHLLAAAKFTPSGSFVGFQDAVATYGHVEQSLLEINRFMAVQLRRILTRAPEPLARRLRTLSVTTRERARFLLEEVKSLAHQTGILKKKREALFDLKNKVRRLIEVNQHQNNCSRVLTCRLANPYGFSSGIHDVLWCLVRGVQLKRPVIVDSQPWHYDPYGWSRIFLPLTYKCPEKPDRSSTWPGNNFSDARGSLVDIPDDIAKELVRLHTDPYAWWLGQFMAYIMRPSQSLFDNLSETKRNITFRSPIVGMHIRRTDKGSEASYHEVEEYMEHAEEYFANIGPVPRRIYVATEDPSVFRELQEKFPRYLFLGDEKASQDASSQSTRYSASALQAVVKDIFLLSQCDLVVCTLSSGVCRVAYELMQARRTDATSHIVSLDVDYFYAYVRFPPRRIIYPHRQAASNELWLREGDYVERLGDQSIIGEARKKKFWDGYSVGGLQGTILTGLFPSFKGIAQCDLVVCTLSSGVCRVAYELMQARRTDATSHIVSLDVDYFYAYVRFPPRRIIYPHRQAASNELWLREGDYVERLGDQSIIGEARKKKFWDGYSVGGLQGTILTGLFPSFKGIAQVRGSPNVSRNESLRRS
ncbi:alpha-(1,6)-fucosyltransferase-like [Ornithodoros turicata]|uniref:alpha-(1,6)-fucosyltransferase-like n=1 Tax=Ornithodoros turicata TaxID=34597 RepID=UPI003139E95A